MTGGLDELLNKTGMNADDARAKEFASTSSDRPDLTKIGAKERSQTDADI